MRKKLLKLTAGGVVGLAISWMATMKPMYRATAVLRFNPGDLPAHLTPGKMTFRNSIMLNAVGQNILSRFGLTTLMLTHGLYVEERGVVPMADVVRQMREQDIRINATDDDTVELSFTYRDPRAAAAVASELAARAIAEAGRGRTNFNDFDRLFFREMAKVVGLEWDALAERLRKSGPNERIALDLDLARKQYVSMQEKLNAVKLVSTLDQHHLGPRLEMADPPLVRQVDNRRLLLWVGTFCGVLAGAVWSWGKPPLPRGVTRKTLLTILSFGVAGCMVAGAVAAYRQHTHRYVSVADLRLSPHALPQELVGGTTIEQEAEVIRDVNRMILTRAVLVNVIHSYGLYPRDKEKGVGVDQLAENLRKDISIRSQKHFGFRIEFRYPDRAKAQRVTQDLVSRMVSEYIDYREKVQRASIRFLQEEVAKAASAWDEASRTIASERRTADIALARKRYIELKEKLYQATLVANLERMQYGGSLLMDDPASLPVEEDETIPILGTGAVIGLLIGLLRKVPVSRWLRDPPDAINSMASLSR